MAKWDRRIRMTERALAALPSLDEGQDRVEWTDEQTAGLRFVQTAGGRGRWMFRYTLGSRKCSMSLGPYPAVDVKEARQRALIAQARLSKGENPAEELKAKKADITLAEFAEKFFFPHQMATKRSGMDDKWAFSRRILPALGKKRLLDIKKQDIVALRNSVVEDGLSETTSNRYYTCIARCLQLAFEWGHIPSNPARGIKKFRELPSKEESLLPSQMVALDAALRQADCKVSGGAIRLLLWSGMRRGEAISLRWEDVNLGSDGFPMATLFLRMTKSGRPRTVPLNSEAVAVLRDMEALRLQSSPYVFHSDCERGFVRDLRGTWVWAKKQAGIPDEFRLHGLRHAFASRLVTQGVSLFVTGRLLGHENSVTTQRYAHLADQTLLQASEGVARTAREAQRGG